jgi:hypothetical protein
MNEAKSKGRVLQPLPKHLMQIAYHQKLTFKQRFQLIFGYALVFDLKVFTTNSTGHFVPRLDVRTTKEQPKKQENQSE